MPTWNFWLSTCTVKIAIYMSRYFKPFFKLCAKKKQAKTPKSAKNLPSPLISINCQVHSYLWACLKKDDEVYQLVPQITGKI